jgi:hypothetical protein
MSVQPATRADRPAATPRAAHPTPRRYRRRDVLVRRPRPKELAGELEHAIRQPPRAQRPRAVVMRRMAPERHRHQIPLVADVTALPPDRLRVADMMLVDRALLAPADAAGHRVCSSVTSTYRANASHSGHRPSEPSPWSTCSLQSCGGWISTPFLIAAATGSRTLTTRRLPRARRQAWRGECAGLPLYSCSISSSIQWSASRAASTSESRSNASDFARAQPNSASQYTAISRGDFGLLSLASWILYQARQDPTSSRNGSHRPT